MKNLEQIRARNALKSLTVYEGEAGGDPLTGFPALIVENGLLAAIAFSLSKKGGHELISDAIADHLSDTDIKLAEPRGLKAKALAEFLAKNDSSVLRLCTAEALAFLNYLRRFVKADKHGEKK